MTVNEELTLLCHVVLAALTAAGSRLPEASAYLCAQHWLQADDGVLLSKPSAEITAPNIDLRKLVGEGDKVTVRRAIAVALGNFFCTLATVKSSWRTEIESLRRLTIASAPEERLLSQVHDQLRLLEVFGPRASVADVERLQEIAAELEATIEQARLLAERRHAFVDAEDQRADLIVGARIAGAQRRDDRSLLTILLFDAGLPPLIIAAVLGELGHQGIAVDLDHPNLDSVRRNVVDRLGRAEKKAEVFLQRIKPRLSA